MSYMELAEEYIGRSNDAILLANWPIQEYTLRHPLAVSKEILLELLPAGIDIGNILNLTKQKQKELAKNINPNSLPIDRTPGYIGQIALYEALLAADYDFSYVVDISDYEWDDKGFTLLYFLLNRKFLLREFGIEDTSLPDGLFERKDTIQQIRYEQLWLDRVMRASWMPRHFNHMQNELLRNLIKNLFMYHEWRSVSIALIQKWCMCSRNQATKVRALMKGLGLRAYNHSIAPNFGLINSFTREFQGLQSNATAYIRCTNIHKETTEHVNFIIGFPEQIDTPHLRTMMFSVNIPLFDSITGKWILKPSFLDTKSLKDCNHLHYYPKNYLVGKQQITQRDVFLAAFLLTLTSYAVDMMPFSIEEYIYRYTGISRKEISLGLRGVHRKKLVIPVYEFASTAKLRRYYLILSQDAPKRIIPYIASLSESTPSCTIRVSTNLDAMQAIVRLPEHLEKEFIEFENNLGKFHDLNRDLYVINQFRRLNASGLMSLVPEFNP
ncbi:MAG: hypothetical protein ACFFEV_02385 [Candidatus Thorarchaeota archaeon]